jgi:hypothetical protein
MFNDSPFMTAWLAYVWRRSCRRISSGSPTYARIARPAVSIDAIGLVEPAGWGNTNADLAPCLHRSSISIAGRDRLTLRLPVLVSRRLSLSEPTSA